jgi:hypothetical protein
VVSEMSACRMRLIIALFHAPVLSCWYVVAVERALVQASVAICVRRVVVRGCFRGGMLVSCWRIDVCLCVEVVCVCDEGRNGRTYEG